MTTGALASIARPSRASPARELRAPPAPEDHPSAPFSPFARIGMSAPAIGDHPGDPHRMRNRDSSGANSPKPLPIPPDFGTGAHRESIPHPFLRILRGTPSHISGAAVRHSRFHTTGEFGSCEPVHRRRTPHSREPIDPRRAPSKPSGRTTRRRRPAPRGRSGRPLRPPTAPRARRHRQQSFSQYCERKSASDLRQRESSWRKPDFTGPAASHSDRDPNSAQRSLRSATPVGDGIADQSFPSVDMRAGRSAR